MPGSYLQAERLVSLIVSLWAQSRERDRTAKAGSVPLHLMEWQQPGGTVDSMNV